MTKVEIAARLTANILIVLVMLGIGCGLAAIPTPTPLPTDTPTPTNTPTVTPTSTPTVVPTPVVLIAPQGIFNFFAAQVLGQYEDAQLSPYMGIMIWFEQEGQQYGAMFGVDTSTGQWVWIDNIPVEKEPTIDTQAGTY